ncbi:MAG: hypothetical protein J6X18_00530 [Bacteroidales bacterium]|nr:hypothetical protein [Bacteroidales bacterium]
MKKLILLLALALVMCGCVQPVGSSRIGKRMPVPIEEGATRLTITPDYIIVETCNGCNGFAIPSWKCDKIMNNDSILQELTSKIKEQ